MVFAGRLALFAGAALLAASGAQPAQKPKLPKPTVLGRGSRFERDPANGEIKLRSGSAPPGAPVQQSAPVIRARVSLVQVGCTVTAPDGTRVRDLTQENFRVREDGAEQKIASLFDAARRPRASRW